MKVTKILHVHCPTYNSAEEEQSTESLMKALKNVLTVADDENLKTLAIPSIGTG